MFPPRLALAGLVLLLCLCPAEARWGEDGHRIVGQIAYANLEPAARAEVDRLLALESTNLPDACYWADAVARKRPEYRFANRLHYANVPRGVKTYDAERDRPPGGDVVSAIPRYAAVLADRTRPDAERLEALRFLGHFVGDLHQPLHVGYADDKGGNDTRVLFYGETWNLHAVWDTGILARCGEPWESLAAELECSVSAADLAHALSVMEPEAWAAESFHIVRSDVYDGIASGAVLGPEFVARELPVVRRRLTEGGLRLAEVINRALADAPDDSAPAEEEELCGMDS